MKNPTHVPVTARALWQRINRTLPEGVVLKKAGRGAHVRTTLGEWYLIRHNRVVRTRIPLEDYGRELRVLQPYERLV
jgi:hypothetical protein